MPNGKPALVADIATDWNGASVDDGRLTVPLLGGPSAEWRDRVAHVIERLEPGEDRSEADQPMTDAFRSLSDDD